MFLMDLELEFLEAEMGFNLMENSATYRESKHQDMDFFLLFS